MSMFKPATLRKGVMAAAAAATALGAVAAPQMAAAQPYGYGPPTYSDVCRDSRNNRTALGALVGAGVGATLGSQMAARGHRTDGSILGGVLGAFGGGAVGRTTSPCRPEDGYAAPPSPPPPPPQAYYDRPPPPPPPPPGPARYDEERYDDGHWAYGPRGQRFRIAERPVGPDGCTLAESPIYMPDGRVQKRFVRVCMDPAGRYQVVD
jgi:hypothetical protein